MTTALKNLAETVTQLPLKDRAYLTERLLESFEESDLERQWIDEAKRRRDDVRSGRVKPVSAEEVYRRIDEILKK